ncbi:MAG: FHA domain-containing protein [Lachnospiraceae bacterium]|nr:FHA domain-containing protein [Lachnospiraceae bacterium]
MALATAILLHTFWNMDVGDMLYILPDGLVVFLYNLKQWFVNYVVLIVLVWMFLLFIMRKCIRQIVAASPVEPGEKNARGAAVPQVVHHERANAKATLLTVTANGFLVLIDRNSSYGTFFSNGTKLEPNTPYKLKGDVRFYLASEKNEFLIHVL